MLGKTHTEEAKALMSRIKKGTGCGSENPMFGKFKTLHHNFGKKCLKVEDLEKNIMIMENPHLIESPCFSLT